MIQKSLKILILFNIYSKVSDLRYFTLNLIVLKTISVQNVFQEISQIIPTRMIMAILRIEEEKIIQLLLKNIQLIIVG